MPALSPCTNWVIAQQTRTKPPSDTPSWTGTSTAVAEQVPGSGLVIRDSTTPPSRARSSTGQPAKTVLSRVLSDTLVVLSDDAGGRIEC
jgi:hypothetical protein